MAQAVEHALAGFSLHQVSHGTSTEAAFGIHILLVHRVHEDLGFRIAGAELLDEIHAAAILEGDVEDDDIGLELADLLKRGGCILAAANKLHVTLFLQKFTKPLDDDGVVV